MANKQINELSELTSPETGDLLPIYDVDEAGSEKTKKIIVERFQWTYTPQTATTAGATVELTTVIPPWATEIEVIFKGVSTNTSNQPPIIQLGDSGGYETSGYDASANHMSTGSVAGSFGYTDGFYAMRIPSQSAADIFDMVFRLTRWDPDEHYWDCVGDGNLAGASSRLFAYGKKTLSAALTSIRLTTPGGSATFDAGEARVRYR